MTCKLIPLFVVTLIIFKHMYTFQSGVFMQKIASAICCSLAIVHGMWQCHTNLLYDSCFLTGCLAKRKWIISGH